jgi:hypothetical protein
MNDSAISAHAKPIEAVMRIHRRLADLWRRIGSRPSEYVRIAERGWALLLDLRPPLGERC